ncbi:hypothetical protein HELRODRAFT_157880 [Helobdella robusta]|uniref:EF-hand domain-containing protein n=1 Tax=Helobdella robusta TaxID=6412 RepID=T1EMH2_HELRO|nr:hypothetical protein HELRODRAFT_157880 [Helobdella robusta]ESN93409.1 hypothetical protein HELRODRAFT_157880 [Helobdella robusta]
MSLSEEYRQQIHEAFDLFDVDKDGVIDYNEFTTAMIALGFDMSKKDISELLQSYKTVPDDITFDVFNDIMTELMLKRDPDEEIMKAFKLFDDDNSGKISFKNLKRVARELGENISDSDLKSMISEFDHDQDGEIDAQEFLAIMKGDK